MLNCPLIRAASRPVQNTNNQLLRPRPYPKVLSIVVPMYNEELVIAHLRSALTQFISELQQQAEVILVNDGSKDSTLSQIVAWAYEDPRVKVINLSRNFGHQNAATAGFDFARGDAVVLMDADLQDPLMTIHEMIARYCEGYDVVYGQRVNRAGESGFKRATAWFFYRVMRSFVYKDLPVDSGDFRLISSDCMAGLRQLRETHRFLRGMVAWVGYSQIGVKYERAARVAGETKYPLRKMVSFAWTAATSFSPLLLRASILFGMVSILIGVEEAIRAILAHILHWYAVPGWSSVIVLVSFLGGVTLMCIGISGEYIGKIYEQSKGRPLYLVARTINVDLGSGCSSISNGVEAKPASIETPPRQEFAVPAKRC
jgi:polyisoprenyl-phosphate glycosyltransferase